MVKNNKIKLIIALTFFFVTIFCTKNVFAVNLGVNVDFNGKEIEMTSETPEMEWKINKIIPGETAENLLIINSTGTKEVTVEAKLEIVENKEIEENLTMKIINNKTNEMVFDGKFTELNTLTTKIPAKETNAFKIIIGLPENIENTAQNNNCKIKIKLIAKGEKNNIVNIATNQAAEEQENKVEEVTTDVIKPMKKHESIVIYIVLLIMVAVLIALGVAFIKTR